VNESLSGGKIQQRVAAAQAAIPVSDRRGAFVYHHMLERLRPLWHASVVEPKNRSGRPWGIGGLRIIFWCC